VKSVYEQEAVRKAYHVDGKSQRQIANELGISRNTVSILVKEQGWRESPLSLAETQA
jgi:DNA-binding transcriptional regulator LsrR (DeoR family)